MPLGSIIPHIPVPGLIPRMHAHPWHPEYWEHLPAFGALTVDKHKDSVLIRCCKPDVGLGLSPPHLEPFHVNHPEYHGRGRRFLLFPIQLRFRQ